MAQSKEVEWWHRKRITSHQTPLNKGPAHAAAGHTNVLLYCADNNVSIVCASTHMAATHLSATTSSRHVPAFTALCFFFCSFHHGDMWFHFPDYEQLAACPRPLAPILIYLQPTRPYLAAAASSPTFKHFPFRCLSPPLGPEIKSISGRRRHIIIRRPRKNRLRPSHSKMFYFLPDFIPNIFLKNSVNIVDMLTRTMSSADQIIRRNPHDPRLFWQGVRCELSIVQWPVPPTVHIPQYFGVFQSQSHPIIGHLILDFSLSQLTQKK